MRADIIVKISSLESYMGIILRSIEHGEKI